MPTRKKKIKKTLRKKLKKSRKLFRGGAAADNNLEYMSDRGNNSDSGNSSDPGSVFSESDWEGLSDLENGSDLGNGNSMGENNREQFGKIDQETSDKRKLLLKLLYGDNDDSDVNLVNISHRSSSSLSSSSLSSSSSSDDHMFVTKLSRQRSLFHEHFTLKETFLLGINDIENYFIARLNSFHPVINLSYSEWIQIEENKNIGLIFMSDTPPTSREFLGNLSPGNYPQRTPLSAGDRSTVGDFANAAFFSAIGNMFGVNIEEPEVWSLIMKYGIIKLILKINQKYHERNKNIRVYRKNDRQWNFIHQGSSYKDGDMLAAIIVGVPYIVLIPRFKPSELTGEKIKDYLGAYGRDVLCKKAEEKMGLKMPRERHKDVFLNGLEGLSKLHDILSRAFRNVYEKYGIGVPNNHIKKEQGGNKVLEHLAGVAIMRRCISSGTYVNFALLTGFTNKSVNDALNNLDRKMEGIQPSSDLVELQSRLDVLIEIYKIVRIFGKQYEKSALDNLNRLIYRYHMFLKGRTTDMSHLLVDTIYNSYYVKERLTLVQILKDANPKIAQRLLREDKEVVELTRTALQTLFGDKANNSMRLNEPFAQNHVSHTLSNGKLYINTKTIPDLLRELNLYKGSTKMLTERVRELQTQIAELERPSLVRQHTPIHTNHRALSRPGSYPIRHSSRSRSRNTKPEKRFNRNERKKK